MREGGTVGEGEELREGVGTVRAAKEGRVADLVGAGGCAEGCGGDGDGGLLEERRGWQTEEWSERCRHCGRSLCMR